MIRTIIKINEEKCNGCGLCAKACHEGAIAMKDGKAKLIRDDYCDGLGNCLPVCPTGAITFEEREAAAFDEAAVNQHKKEAAPVHTGGCPGSRAKLFRNMEEKTPASCENIPSELMQWPVQLKLAPINAPYFQHANLLIAADCSAYAYGNFHREFMRNHITLIGCPKLDSGDYEEKLAEIFRQNEIESVRVVRMEVPCCGGIEYAVNQALQNCGKSIPLQVVVLSTDGQINQC